jgi:hypothetical protein
MKRLILWFLSLLTLSAGVIYLGYLGRNFATMLAGFAIGLVALAVLIRPLRATITAIVSLMLALAMAEVALGLVPEPASAQATLDPTTDYVKHYWSHTDIGALPRPGKHTTRKLAPDGSEIYSTAYTIGNDGFRVTPGNPVGSKKRVNFLGCSHTFGEGLADDQTLPAQVQKLMPDVTVRNFGIHGYGMHQALALMQSQRDMSGQVNVAVTVPWHAERSACVPAYSLGSPRFLLQADGTVHRSGICGGIPYYPLARILSLSKVYRLAKTAIQTRQSQDAQIELYLGILREMSDLSAARQQVLKIGFFNADPTWFTGTYSNEKVLNAIKAMKLEVIDMNLSDKEQYRNMKLILHPLDEHASALANEITGPIVAESLMKLPGFAQRK